MAHIDGAFLLHVVAVVIAHVHEPGSAVESPGVDELDRAHVVLENVDWELHWDAQGRQDLSQVFQLSHGLVQADQLGLGASMRHYGLRTSAPAQGA